MSYGLLTLEQSEIRDHRACATSTSDGGFATCPITWQNLRSSDRTGLGWGCRSCGKIFRQGEGVECMANWVSCPVCHPKGCSYRKSISKPENTTPVLGKVKMIVQ